MKAYDILKYLVKRWCTVVGQWLQLDSYLLSENDRKPPPTHEHQNERPAGQDNPQPAAVVQQLNNLADRHQALLVAREAPEVEPYFRPNHFYLRLIALLTCVAVTSVILSLVLLVVPGI